MSFFHKYIIKKIKNTKFSENENYISTIATVT
jgi:hypothetical protein